MSEYEPGKCNIGFKEKRNRAILGVSGLLAAALMTGIIVDQGLPNYVLLLTSIPLLLGFEGIYQALTSFCVHYAHKGVYEQEGELQEVEDEDNREKDEEKAFRIHAASLVSSAISTAAVYLVVAFQIKA